MARCLVRSWRAASKIQSPTPRSLDEYCSGDRIVTVNGSRVAIADYGEQRLTEIDHERATWSVTSFVDIAKSRPAVPESKTSKVKIEIDRTVALSREAVTTQGIVDSE